MTDLEGVDVYPLRREPQGYRYESDAPPLDLVVQRPTASGGPPALVFALSATVTPERIHGVLGADAAIWRVGVEVPDNDLVKSRAHLSEFRKKVRRLLNDIKAVHGESTMLHIFPAMGIPLAVELGRVRMPKAGMPWRVYDQIPGRGFVPALDVHGGSISAAMPTAVRS